MGSRKASDAVWLLVLTIAMAPNFEPIYQQARYLTKKDCVRALELAEDLVAEDGVIIIGECKQEKR